VVGLLRVVYKSFEVMSIMIEYLIAFIMSGTPVIEGRGAIAYAAASGLNLWYVFPLAIFGNLIIIPITFWLLDLAHFSDWVYRLFGKRFEKKIKKYTKQFENWEELALLLFVAVPLPVTGAFTAIAISRILNLKKRKSTVVIGAGVIISTTIALLLSLGIISLL
jgi:uncharacterized membrane protein